jgi:SAM-dependent methyltransferase
VKYHDRRRAGSFGDDAEQYDRTRPAYPVRLIDHLLQDQPELVVDAGCGTGIASRLFAKRGCQVVGVEADPRMAAVARRYGCPVEEGRFEDWKPAGRRFDLVVSAQAWHWIDPVAGARKALKALRTGGRIGVFWNRGDPPDDVRAALHEAYRRAAPGLGEGYVLPSAALTEPDADCERAAAAFRTAGGFADPTIRVFTHSVVYTTAQWLDLLPTHSDHRTLPASELAQVLAAVGQEIDRIGAIFRMGYQTWLAEARTVERA